MNLGYLYQIILKLEKEIIGYGQLAQHLIFAYHMVRQTPLIDFPRCASLVNTYFSTIGEKLNSTFTANDNSYLPPQVSSRFRLKIITEISVLKAIKALKPKRSFGHDKVSSFFIKIAAPFIAKSLAKIYKAWFPLDRNAIVKSHD